jgi:basic membrane protein A
LVTLVLDAPRNPIDACAAGSFEPMCGLEHAAQQDTGLRTRVLYGGGTLKGFLRKIAKAAPTSDLVIVDEAPNEEATSKLTRQFRNTHFLVFDSVSDPAASFSGQRNVTGINFHDRENAYLGGYLAGLMTHGSQAVSAVGGDRTQAVRNLIEGFTAGARRARPGIRVLVNYTSSAGCEAAANRQIDRGSHVVFAAPLDCGFGAIPAANLRGVWALGIDDDLSYMGPNVLASVVKHRDRAVELGVSDFASRQLPGGKDIQLDLTSTNIGLVGVNGEVPAAVRSKVEEIDAKLRARDQARDSR